MHTMESGKPSQVGRRSPALAADGALALGRQLYRLWIAKYGDWTPAGWQDVPPVATAIEPASEAAFSAEDAQLFVEGFNGQMLREARKLWVIAVPVTVRFEGDLLPGDLLHGGELAPGVHN